LIVLECRIKTHNTGDLIETDETCLYHEGQIISSAKPNTIQKDQMLRKSLNMRDEKRVVASRSILLSKTLITAIKTPKLPTEADAFIFKSC